MKRNPSKQSRAYRQIEQFVIWYVRERELSFHDLDISVSRSVAAHFSEVITGVHAGLHICIVVLCFHLECHHLCSFYVDCRFLENA